MAAPKVEAKPTLQKFLDGKVIDLLEFISSEGRDLHVSIDPDTHLPVRVAWKPTGGADDQRSAVEIELLDYRPVESVQLPHRMRVYVAGQLAMIDTIADYTLKQE